MTMSALSPTADDDLETLSGVIRRQRSRLAAVARKEGLDPEDAIDCVQDALCAFLATPRDERTLTDRDIVNVLVAMVRNQARNKRRRHHLSRPHDDTYELVADVQIDTLVARAEDHVRLRACVARLCDTQRAVVTLRLLEELPGEDVASSLGIDRGHVDVLLHRAKGKLRACMDEWTVA